MKRCSGCQWWKDARLTAQMQDIAVDENGCVVTNAKALGYCEPINPECTGMWKGLTAADYSCGEHKERER